ncbi:hypothetical protein NEOLEDRAFT_917981 [Neolentinus lepideus HHB14362 ss-1]|uniref:CoA-dependent acyltransferase n=1 Tax=Neolentinus lepideus HHB14362 ss-1 TaxID=1314782 RepID=A0A165UM87_9AGAM|nr:hypothetical protein NEOLEDRAFT_917981 [Neolentinus lepideus HHB14362 ss-1]
MNSEINVQDGPSVHTRPLWGKEKFYYVLDQYYFGLTNAAVQVTMHCQWDEAELEERVDCATTLVSTAYPIMLAYVAPHADSARMRCTVPKTWNETRKAISAKIKKYETLDNEKFMETILTEEVGKIRGIHFFWAPLYQKGDRHTYTFALAGPHSLVDAHGAMILLSRVLTAMPNALELTHTQWSVISKSPREALPPPLNTLRATSKATPDMASRCMKKWREDNSKISYVLPPKTRARSSEGVSRRVVFTFSEEESMRLFQKHRSLGVTMNTALQASLWMATVILAPPSAEHYKNHHCLSVFGIDARPQLKPEWQSYIGVGLTDACFSCPLGVATGPDRKVALTQMMQKISADMKFWRENMHALLDTVEITTEGTVPRLIDAAQNGMSNCNAFTANLGVMDHMIPHLYGTAGSRNAIEISEIAGISRVTQPQYVTRAWTYKGKCTIQVGYNDYFYDTAQIEEFLKTGVEVLRSTLEL